MSIKPFNLYSLPDLVRSATFSQDFKYCRIKPLPGIVLATGRHGLELFINVSLEPDYIHSWNRREEQRLRDLETSDYERMMRESHRRFMQNQLDDDIPF